MGIEPRDAGSGGKYDNNCAMLPPNTKESSLSQETAASTRTQVRLSEVAGSATATTVLSLYEKMSMSSTYPIRSFIGESKFTHTFKEREL